MKSKLYCKTLAVGIIVLLVGVSVVSSAVDVNRDVDDEARKKPEFKPLDNDREIFTWIDGAVCDCSIGKGFIIHHAEMSVCDDQTYLDVGGFKYSTDGKIVRYVIQPKSVIAPWFIGYCFQVHPMYRSVHGIAFGNIEWS